MFIQMFDDLVIGSQCIEGSWPRLILIHVYFNRIQLIVDVIQLGLDASGFISDGCIGLVSLVIPLLVAS